MKIENCKLKIIRRTSGLTLVELLIVISITIVLAGVTFFGSGLFGFKQDRDLSLSADGIVATLRTAQTRAASQEGGTAWGVRFVNPASGAHYYQIFSGSSYSPANVAGHHLLSGATTFTLPTSSSTKDVIFSAATGRPTNTAAIALSAAVRPNVATVFVNSGGTVTSIADRGLVGYWPVDTATGTVAFDSSGSGNTGTLIGGTAWATGKIRSALNFDGVDDFVNVPSSASLDITGAITIGAWVMRTGTAETWAGIVAKENTDIGTGYGIIYNALGVPAFRSRIGGAWNNLEFAEFPLNTWRHVVATYDGSFMRVYLDGVLSVSMAASGSIATNTFTLRIGRQERTTATHFLGRIDEVRIYNRALSASEIRTIHNATK